MRYYETQKIYTIYSGKKILTLIKESEIGLLEIFFKLPNDLISNEKIAIQEDLSIAFEEQHSMLNATIDEYNEKFYRCALLTDRIRKICNSKNR